VVAIAAGLVVLLVMPIYLTGFWLGVGLFSMSAALGAIGLNLLMGTAGQLSLGHAFFVAVGAYGYAWFAGDSGRQGTVDLHGLGLPPVLAFVLAVLLAGLAGVLFSPISGRMRGLYLAVATLALVYIGHHVLLNAKPVTGGFNGRGSRRWRCSASPSATQPGHAAGRRRPVRAARAPVVPRARSWSPSVGGSPATCCAAGPVGRWPACATTSSRRRSWGVPVARYRAAAFTVSSMYAGAAGVLLGLVYERIVPDSFGIMISINFIAMIVIGGLGSVGGAVAGAVFVSALPLVLGHYAEWLPLVVPAGMEAAGVSPVEASNYLYGLAIIVILVFAPGGLAGTAQSLTARLRRVVRRGEP
jgi:branched-chain amino acid transport system permease protein